MQPAALFDPVPGNVGLRKLGTLMLRLDTLDGVLAADEEGHLDNLAPDGAHTNFPAAAAGWTKPLYTIPAGKPGAGASSGARAFVAGSSNAMIAADLAGEDTLLLRDVTIQMFIALPTGVGTEPEQVILARGKHDGTASEAYSYGLELFGWDGAGTYGIRFFWEDTAGTIRTDAGVALPIPGNGQFFLVTATRRWESTSSLMFRYYANDQKLGETTSTHGDISGGTTGHTTIGGRVNLVAGSIPAGFWEHFLTATIDELAVGPFEMSLEEVRQVYKRLTEYQPAGVDMFTGLIPVGAKWATNPGNRIGRRVKVVGQGIGQAYGAAEELRALWLPDACTIDNAPRWEGARGLAVKPNDSLDVRRARIIGNLSQQNGYAVPQVQQALTEVFDLDAGDIQILEFSQDITDDFTTLQTERWYEGDVGAFSIVAGALHCAWAGGTDARWEPTRAQAFITTPMPMSSDLFFAAWEVTAYTLPINTLVGAVVRNGRTNNAMWFGVYSDGGGTKHIGWCNFIDNTMGAFTALAAAPAAPIWFRLEQIETTGVPGPNDRRYRMSWGTTGSTPTSSFTTDEEQFAFPDPEWFGFGAVSTDAALAGNASVDVDNFVLHTPNSERPWYWYAYRDPGLSGTADLIGAHGLVQKLKPAHTYAAAIESKSLLCDDPRDGLLDRGPMGAL